MEVNGELKVCHLKLRCKERRKLIDNVLECESADKGSVKFLEPIKYEFGVFSCCLLEV